MSLIENMNARDAENPSAQPTAHGLDVPLSGVAPGQEVILTSISGGRQLQHRLTEMGLVRGSRFRVIANAHRGPFIVSVKDTRLALGRGVVHKILVRAVQE